MMHDKRISLLLAALWVLAGAPIQAQSPAPAPEAPAAPPAAEEPGSPAPALETDPAVRAALTLPRREPADYLTAVTALIELGRTELAQPIMDELTKLQLTDTQRAALVHEFGSRAMLQLARTKELAPAGAEFANACMAAASAAANDETRIDALITQLTDPSPEVRALARNDLAATGRAGVIATLEALAKEPDSNRRNALLRAAAEMDPLVRGPALAMLDSNDPFLRADIAALLQHLNVPQAAPLLPMDFASAEQALNAAIEQYRRGMLPFAVNEKDEVEFWRWCGSQLIVELVPADDSRLIWMSKLAQQRAQIRPKNEDYLREAIALSLEAAALVRWAYEEGGQPHCPSASSQKFERQIPSADLQLLNRILTDALEAHNSNAAIAIANELGRRRDAHVLFTANGQLSPLTDALHYPNRHVRFAALEAIMAIDSATPYPGASRVPEALAWFASANEERRAIVAMPSLAAATSLAGMMNGLGFRAEPTNNGLQAVKLARQMPDLEMVFIDMDIDTRGIRDALYELRIHPNTGEIPIALLAPDGELAAAEKLASEHERVIAAPRPHSTEVVARLEEQLAAISSRPRTDPQQRFAEAEQARRWLDELVGTRPFDTIRRTALTNPASAPAPHPAEALPAPPES